MEGEATKCIALGRFHGIADEQDTNTGNGRIRPSNRPRNAEAGRRPDRVADTVTGPTGSRDYVLPSAVEVENEVHRPDREALER